MTQPPDWVTAVPSTSGVHPSGTEQTAFTPPFTQAQLLQIGSTFLEQFVGVVVKAIVGVFIPGADGSAFAQLQTWATDIESLIGNVPAEIAAAIQGLAQQVIAQILAVITGAGTAGNANSPASSLLGVLNEFLALPGELWSQIFSQNASQQAQINALASGGFTYDPAINGVTGWSNLVGTLALSSRGAFIQAPTETVAYRSSGLSVDKYGVNFTLTPSMRGVFRMGICVDPTGSSGVDLEVYRGFDGDALRLVTRASPTLTAAQAQADFAGTNRFSGPISLSLQTDGVSKFSVIYNTAPVPALAWDDGGLATHNASHRGVILTSNGLNRNEDSFYGPALTGKVVSYAA